MPTGRIRLDNNLRFWAGYFGNFNNVDNHSGYHGYSQNSNGFLAGLTWDPTLNWSLGGYAGYSRAKADFDEMDATVRTDTFHIGLFARYNWLNGFKLTGDVAYSRHEHDMDRNAGGLGKTESDFSQDVLSIGLEAAYDIKVWESCLTPFAAVRQSWLSQDGFTEHGGMLNTRMDGAHLSNFSSNIGVRASTSLGLGNTTLKPSLSASWWHDYGDEQVSASGKFTERHFDGSTGMGFTVKSRKHRPDAVLLQVGLDTDTRLESGVSWGLNISYGLELREKVNDHMLYGGLEIRF